ncbi:protein phosphatase regulator [Coemansia sp. RSA 552]|nr:protein phosphatase regulator [Coemansia sp. RSA 552]
MDKHSDLVDVLLLPDCNLYERYPGLVQRVDYFLFDWREDMLARTESLLRRQSRGLRNSEATKERCGASGDEAFTHTRSLNVVWRQWAVARLQLPRYPPERINWNKDADPVFLYGQVPALRLEIPWSAHDSRVQKGVAREHTPSSGLQLKPALKRTDLQTFLTSPTLSPVSSPLYSPLYSPAVSIRENMSTSSLGSDETLESEGTAAQFKPRLRFNDRVEQCMVVFDQEKEYLPTDYEDDSADEGAARRDGVVAKRTHRRTRSGSTSAAGARGRRGRRTLVIKLAPTHLKGDHRRLLSVSADPTSRYAGYIDSDDEEDPFGDYGDSFAMFGDFPTAARQQASRPVADGTSGSGVGGYVQGCVQSVAGQVRRFVSDAVLVSSFAKEHDAKTPQSPHAPTASDCVVSDPFANHQSSQSPGKWIGEKNDTGVCSRRGSQDVVRDPFAATPNAASVDGSALCDRIPFDDDEDAIIQEFEREMHKYNTAPHSPYYALPAAAKRHSEENPSHQKPAASQWAVDDYDIYDSEYQLHTDDNDGEYDDYTGDYGFSGFGRATQFGADRGPNCRAEASPPAGKSASLGSNRGAAAVVAPHALGLPASGDVQHREQRQLLRNDSLIDRAEDTIVNTVDAVKWCASFISNYTIF